MSSIKGVGGVQIKNGMSHFPYVLYENLIVLVGNQMDQSLSLEIFLDKKNTGTLSVW